MPSFDFDAAEADFNKSIGATAEVQPADDDTDLALPPSERSALRAAAAQPATGVTVEQPNAAASVDLVPDYLKEFLAEKPAATDINWNDRYKERLGEGKVADGEAVDAERFHSDVTATNEEQAYLKAVPQYNKLYDIANATYASDEDKYQADLSLLQNAVAESLGNDLTEIAFDKKMAEYLEEGQFKPDGIKRVKAIRENIGAWLEQTRGEAKKYGQEAAKSLAEGRKEYREFIPEFKVLDMPIDQEDQDFVRDFTLNGDIYDRLSNLSKEDHALITIVLDPYMRAKYFGLKQYERGASQGAKQKLAQRLN